MSDGELAFFSFVVAAVNGQDTVTRAVSGEKVLNCISIATGISAIRDLSISGLVNARTVLQVVKAIGLRYVGYIGLAYTIYSAVECFS